MRRFHAFTAGLLACLSAAPAVAQVQAWQVSSSYAHPAGGYIRIAVDASGNIVQARSYLEGGEPSQHVSKHSGVDGSLIWEAKVPNSGHPNGVATDAAGDVYTTGYDAAAWNVLKFNGSNGSLVWSNRAPTGRSYAGFLQLDGSGSVYYTLGGSHIKAAAATGVTLQAIPIPSGTYLVRRSVTGDVFMIAEGGGWITRKYAANGALAWERLVPGCGQTCPPRDLGLLADGSVVVTGTLYRDTDHFNPQNTSAHAILYSSDGSTAWSRTFPGGESLNSVAVDDAGNVYVGGTFTAKLARADGVTQWSRANLTGGGLSFDGAGRLVVSGLSYEDNLRRTLLRLDPASGATQWYRADTAAPHAVVATGDALHMAHVPNATAAISKVLNPAGAQTSWTFPIEGTQEVPRVFTAAEGLGLAIYDPSTMQLELEVQHAGLPATAAHLHGPAARGAAAGVQIDLGSPTSPIHRTYTLSASQAADLLAGQWYVNVHTAANPGGEIRGQVDGLGSAGKLVRVIKTGSGTATVRSTTPSNALDCGSNCEQLFPAGSTVDLAPGIDPGTQFTSWGGDCGAINTCIMVLDRSKTAILTLRDRVARHDFDGSGRPDIFFRNSASGANFIWRMNGLALASDQVVSGVHPSYRLVGHGDFNGDFKNDLVWRSLETGTAYAWFMNNGVYQYDAFLFTIDPVWQVEAVADFNKDGKPDFLFRHATTGSAFIWHYVNTTPQTDVYAFTVGNEWIVENSADFNNDGYADFFFRNTSTGLGFVWLWTGTGMGESFFLFSIDPAWQVSQIADWNGDGKVDLVFRHANSGVTFVWYTDGVQLQGSDFLFQVDPPWEIVPRR